MIENFGKNISNLRREKNVSQEELAEYVGVGKAAISKIELGTSFPTFANLEKIAQYFDATPTQLFGTELEIQLEISRKNIDEYEKKATHILEAAKAISDIEKTLFKVEPKITISDDGKKLYTLMNSKTGETILTENTINSEYDVIVKEPNLYTQILKVSESIQDIKKLSSDDPLRQFFRDYDINKNEYWGKNVNIVNRRNSRKSYSSC